MSTTLAARAQEIYTICQTTHESKAVERIEDMLRATRHEGINRGADLAEKYPHIERKSA